MTVQKTPRNIHELKARAKESLTNISRHRQAMRDVVAVTRNTVPAPPPQTGGGK